MLLSEKPLVLLITNFQGIIPQRITAWEGYDLEQLKKLLELAGAEVCIVGAHELDILSCQKRKFVAALYASSQESHYKQYLQDIVANMHFIGVELFPAFEHMLAHENKAFQGLKIALANIKAPRSFVFGHKQQANQFLAGATLPLVGKAVDGFGACKVCLIRSIQEGRKFIRKQMFHRVLRNGRPFLLRVLQRIFKPQPVLGHLVFQEMIPDLKGDWKVLIWGDTACGLYRENRPKDFRASGSGKFAFVDVPNPVLDFAREALDALNLKWASFDIGYDGKDCYLIEYQGIHFGLTAAEKGYFYYVRDSSGAWVKRRGKIQIETEMAKIIVRTLTKRGWLKGETF